jgi:hypothetical protein
MRRPPVRIVAVVVAVIVVGAVGWVWCSCRSVIRQNSSAVIAASRLMWVFDHSDGQPHPAAGDPGRPGPVGQVTADVDQPDI